MQKIRNDGTKKGRWLDERKTKQLNIPYQMNRRPQRNAMIVHAVIQVCCVYDIRAMKAAGGSTYMQARYSGELLDGVNNSVWIIHDANDAANM